MKIFHQLVILSAGFLFGIQAPANADTFNAKVISVIDGDTLTVSHDGTKERLILYGIDCPELSQEFGPEAKKFTDDLCYGKTVGIEDHGRDARGRTIGVVLLPDNSNLNQELVKHGYAWWSDKYAPNDLALKQLQTTAKAEKRGLWLSPNAIPPWIFRNGEKAVQATVRPSAK